ncbi:MAG: primase, partial [Pseudomonadota bacterium]
RFLTELEGLSFPEAVEQIADLAGVPMPQPDPEAERREEQRTTLLDIMEMATQFFEDQLQTAVGAKARAYLRERGLTGKTIETFRLGFAPDSRNALKEHLAQKGASKEQIEACGLVVHGPDIPVSYDRFRDRIMFPILNAREKVIAFGGRAMSADAPAKYLNSNENELFSKGSILYNFARARKSIQGADGADTIIAVEGYMDVIALYQAGIENAVAPLGTALTENQLDLLWKLTPQPVLCFDGDSAGIRAANRGVDLALPRLVPGKSVRFAMLPDGKDPDDLVKQDGRAPFDAVMAQARPLAEMVWTRETASGGFDTPEKRAELEARLKSIVAVIADENVRRHYQQDIRDRLNAFFQGSQRGGSRREPFQRGERSQGRNSGKFEPKTQTGVTNISERLARSGMVRGHRELPPLRESVLALTIANHPHLLLEDYDTISALEFDNKDLQRFWSALLGGTASFAGPNLNRESLSDYLREHDLEPMLKSLDQQIRNARLWTATSQAALEDARESFRQVLALHNRSKALRRQKIELQREIAEATEAGDEDGLEHLLRSLNEVHLEALRLENQDAIIEGFGILSGKVKGPAHS